MPNKDNNKTQIEKKKPKKRAKKYDEKLQINGTFDDLLKELATPKETIKKK
jgi:hypothetical protein